MEILAGGLRLAYCHGTSATPEQVRAETWRDEQRQKARRRAA